MVWLECADELIIYGLSLSPLDAELSLVLSESMSERRSQLNVTVIDREPLPVAARIKFLLGSKLGNLTLLTPEQLSQL